MEQQTASTICENACKSYVNRYLDNYRNIFTDYNLPKPTTDPMQLLRNEKYVCDKMHEFESREIEACTLNVRAVVDEYIGASKTRIEEQRVQIEREHANAVESLKRKHAMLEEDAKANASSEVAQVMAKRDGLVSYKDKLTEVFERYSILPDNVEISSDTTIPELMQLYDEAIKVCNTYFKSTGGKLLSKLRVPVEQLTETEGWLLLFGACIAVTLVSPILLVWYVVRSIKSTADIYSKIDKLKVASALMYEGDFDRFLDKDKYVVADEDTSEIDAALEEQLSQLESIDDISKAFDDYINSHLNEMQESFNNAYESASHFKQSGIEVLQEAYIAIHQAVEVLQKSFKPLGTEISQHFYIDRKFQIGTVSNVLPINIDMPMQNMIFVRDKNYLTEILPFIKVLMLNALFNVKEKHLYINIVDGTDLGTHFSEFFDKRFPDIVTLITKEPSQVIEDIKAEEVERVKLIKTSDIDTLNKEHEEIGKIPIDYQLYILAGDLNRVVEDTGFLGLMRHSAKYGIWLWYIGDMLQVEDCTVVNGIPRIEGTIYNCSKEFVTPILDKYSEEYENSKDRGILYLESFANKYLPRDKWWTYNTKKGIELNFGLEDGDPDKGYSITLGDAPVHGNMVGATGAGKSVCINQLLASLITRYSPTELSLVMIDFKNVEFSFYADQETHEFSRLPHSQVLAGTKDGEYAVSIFEYLCGEMDRRTAIFSADGVKNLEEYRNKHPEAVMPRILVLIDEYQVMFTELPTKIVNRIMTLIRSLAKLARFCGCHMFFTSQSMKGTMDKDVQDQFALRAALRCSADTAAAVLGDEAPSRLKTKNGYLYTNEDGGNTKDRNKLWRTPFISTEVLNDIITVINQMWNKPNMVEFYDEKRVYTDSTLHQWYSKYPDVWTNPHIVILGEKTSYSVNKAPSYMEFKRDDGENLLVFGSETSDVLNIILTLVDNIKHQGDKASIMMHSADRDVIDMIDMRGIVGERLAAMIDPSYDFNDLLDFWEKVIAGRKAKAAEDLKPLYIFCVNYEKQTGYGRNSSSRITARFESVMNEAGAVDMHFILVMKNKGELMASSLKKFNHRIILRCEESIANQLCDDSRPAQFPSNPKEGVFGLYVTLGSTVKFKVYLHTFAKPLVSNEIFIG